MIKTPPANAGDLGSIPGLGRSPEGGHGNPLLENPMDRGACWATVHMVAQSQTQLKQFSMQACILSRGALKGFMKTLTFTMSEMQF